MITGTMDPRSYQLTFDNKNEKVASPQLNSYLSSLSIFAAA